MGVPANIRATMIGADPRDVLSAHVPNVALESNMQELLVRWQISDVISWDVDTRWQSNAIALCIQHMAAVHERELTKGGRSPAR